MVRGFPRSAPSTKNDPVSTRSGMVTNGAFGVNKFPPVPVISMVGVPAPFICAPDAFKNSARCGISGSKAAFRSTVFPWASDAVIIKVSVAVTLIFLKVKRAPASLAARASNPCSDAFTFAPKALNPSIKMSMGRFPITHPPGYGEDTFFCRARSGPVSTMEARSLSAISFLSSAPFILELSSKSSRSPFRAVSAPRSSSKSVMRDTSSMAGTFFIKKGLEKSGAAAIAFRAEFFAPRTGISPCKGVFPTIWNSAIPLLYKIPAV